MVSAMPEFITSHPNAFVIALAICLWISLCLIARLWITQRSDALVRKFAWSIVLLVPLVGWLFYSAFYHPPARVDGAGVEHGLAAWGDHP
jgi:hypothetical protein